MQFPRANEWLPLRLGISDRNSCSGVPEAKLLVSLSNQLLNSSWHTSGREIVSKIELLSRRKREKRWDAAGAVLPEINDYKRNYGTLPAAKVIRRRNSCVVLSGVMSCKSFPVFHLHSPENTNAR